MFLTRGPLFGLDGPLYGRCALGLGAALAAVGTWRWIRDGEYERAALLVGLLLWLTCLHLLGGSQVFAGEQRYASVLITPSVLVLACLVQSLSPRWGKSASMLVRAAPTMVLGGVFLAAERGILLEHCSRTAGESIWTFRAYTTDPYREAIEIIEDDLSRRRRGGTTGSEGDDRRYIIAQDHFTYMPIAYLTLDRKPLRPILLISQFEVWQQLTGMDAYEPKLRRLRDRLLRGDYAVAWGNFPEHAGGKIVESAIGRIFEPGSVRRWRIPHGDDISVFRLERPVAPVARSVDPVPQPLR